MNMSVIDRLASGFAAIDSNIHPVDSGQNRDLRSNLVNKFEQLAPLPIVEIFNPPNMTLGHDEHVPFGYGESVWKCHRCFVVRCKTRCGFDPFAEWAPVHSLSVYRTVRHDSSVGQSSRSNASG